MLLPPIPKSKEPNVSYNTFFTTSLSQLTWSPTTSLSSLASCVQNSWLMSLANSVQFPRLNHFLYIKPCSFFVAWFLSNFCGLPSSVFQGLRSSKIRGLCVSRIRGLTLVQNTRQCITTVTLSRKNQVACNSSRPITLLIFKSKVHPKLIRCTLRCTI